MKKIISILMSTFLALTALSCTTALASSATPDENDILFESSYLERQIIYCVAERVGQSVDDIVLTDFYQLSDTTAIYSYALRNYAPSSVPEKTIIGKYKYHCNSIDKVYCFADSEIYTLNSAYISGVISDEQLDEIAKVFNENFEVLEKDDLLFKIREELLKNNKGINPDSIIFYNIYFLNSGKVLFNYTVEGMQYPTIVNIYHIGKYTYSVGVEQEAYLYTDSMVYRIAEAYSHGIIDDEELEEITSILSFYFDLHDDSDAPFNTEPSTEDMSNNNQPTTKKSTDDETPTDPTNKSGNDPRTSINNGDNAISTGHSSIAVLLVLCIATISAVIFKKFEKQ
ncbi:MAG: hypothetical protein J1E85_05755 [Ruminococcus sp.]|nr:hypothetical protein [Ruminococcus sp.]